MKSIFDIAIYVALCRCPGLDMDGLVRDCQEREVVDVEYEEVSSKPLGSSDAPALDAVLVTRSRAYPDSYNYE